MLFKEFSLKYSANSDSDSLVIYIEAENLSDAWALASQ
jgi:hypothetical protein